MGTLVGLSLRLVLSLNDLSINTLSINMSLTGALNAPSAKCHSQGALNDLLAKTSLTRGPD